MIEKFAYFAGIVDGEGTVTLSGNLIYSTPYLSVSNINTELMDWIKLNFDGNIRIVKPNNKQYWQRHNVYKWDIFGEKAINILRDIFPWLIIKKKQTLILFDWELLRLPSNKGTKRRCRNSVSEEEKQRRFILLKEIRMLNKRGKKYKA